MALRWPPAATRVVHLGDAHVVVTPMAKGVRLAGTMEFDPHHDRFNPRRITGIVAAARPYLDARPLGPAGQRVGRCPTHDPRRTTRRRRRARHRDLLASGHNMLGLMLGPCTGELVAGLVHGTKDPVMAGRSILRDSPARRRPR